MRSYINVKIRSFGYCDSHWSPVGNVLRCILAFFPNLHSDMVSQWPRQQAQTKAAMKKGRLLEEKVLAEIKKRVSQIDETLRPALKNVTANTTKEAEQTAQAVAKVCGPLLGCRLVQQNELHS